MIVFFDTNVLVSALATRGICADLLNAIIARHRLAIGETVIAELRRVAVDKLRMQPRIVDETESFLRRHADVVAVPAPCAVTGLDESDRFVLAEAMAARADALVTGDRELLALGALAPLRILSPRGFWELLRVG